MIKCEHFQIEFVFKDESFPSKRYSKPRKLELKARAGSGGLTGSSSQAINLSMLSDGVRKRARMKF